jgi:xanthine/uracil permease
VERDKLQHGLKYGLDDRPPLIVTLLGALQWVGFVVAANAMVPLVLGDAFGFAPAQVGALTQRALFLIGLASLLQLWQGHRLPLSEGVSYVWLGVFVTLAGVERAAGHAPQLLLPAVEGGLIFAGLLLVALAASGLAGPLQRLFTPTVVATYLMLLPIQFSGPFLRSMLGASAAAGQLDLRIAGVSLLAVVATLAFSFLGRGWVRSVSSLLGLAVGATAWVLAGLPLGAGLSGGAGTAAALLPPPRWGFLFAWGVPRLEAGVAVTSALTGFLLLSNVVASLSAAEQVTGAPATGRSFRRATILNGLGSVLAGAFSGVGLIPVATSAGFISLTGLAARLPFLLSCLLLIGVSFWAPVARLVTLLPLPLAYAVTFAAFNEMFGLGVLRLRQASLTRGNLATLSVSIFIGTGLMFLPPATLAGLHPVLRSLLGNGLLTGALLSLLLEHLVFRRLTAPV